MEQLPDAGGDEPDADSERDEAAPGRDRSLGVGVSARILHCLLHGLLRRVRPAVKTTGNDSVMISFQYYPLSSRSRRKKADGIAVRFEGGAANRSGARGRGGSLAWISPA